MADRQHGDHCRGDLQGHLRVLCGAVCSAGRADRSEPGAGGAAGGAVPGTDGRVPQEGKRRGVSENGAERRVSGGVCDGSEKLREFVAVLSE